MFLIYQEEEELMVLRTSNIVLTDTKSNMSKHLSLFFACIILAPMLICGCSHFNEGFEAKSTFIEANDFFSQGNYKASLGKYEQILEKYPTAGDRVLFEMGIIYAYPGNEQKNYQNSLECFCYIRKRMRNGSAIIKHITNGHEVEYG